MGLPRAEIPVALLLFNLGVEAGQMLFVLLIVLLARAFRILEMRWPRLGRGSAGLHCGHAWRLLDAATHGATAGGLR